LAVFAGGWTLEAAETGCEGEPLQRSDVLEVLMRLVDQSLVNVQTEDGRTITPLIVFAARGDR